jgi:hypothetical protein
MKQGVYFDPERSKWRARKKIDGHNKHIGWFDSREAAQAAYDRENIDDYRRVPFNVALARVLAELKKSRDLIDRAISMIETLKGGMTPVWPSKPIRDPHELPRS